MANPASNDVRDPFGVRGTVDAGGQTYSIFCLPKLTEAGIANIDRLPFVVDPANANAFVSRCLPAEEWDAEATFPVGDGFGSDRLVGRVEENADAD